MTSRERGSYICIPTQPRQSPAFNELACFFEREFRKQVIVPKLITKRLFGQLKSFLGFPMIAQWWATMARKGIAWGRSVFSNQRRASSNSPQRYSAMARLRAIDLNLKRAMTLQKETEETENQRVEGIHAVIWKVKFNSAIRTL